MRGLFIAFPLALASVTFAGPISITTPAAPSTPHFTAMPRMTAAFVVAAPPAPTTTAAPTTLITMASDLEPRKHKNNHHQHDKDHYGYGGCSEYWDGRLITNCPSVIATTYVLPNLSSKPKWVLIFGFWSSDLGANKICVG